MVGGWTTTMAAVGGGTKPKIESGESRAPAIVGLRRRPGSGGDTGRQCWASGGGRPAVTCDGSRRREEKEA